MNVLRKQFSFVQFEHKEVVRLNLLLALLLCSQILIFIAPATAAPTIPEELYRGCEEQRSIPVNTDDPRDRITNRNVIRTDPITERSFASFSLEELESGTVGQQDDLCWFRLDGVWRETGEVVLDTDQPINGWGSDSEESLTLANGTYTTPSHLYIKVEGEADTALLVRDGLLDTPYVEFRSSDGLSLNEVFQRNGPAKIYRTRQPFVFGDQLVVDVSRTGRIRLTFDDTTFIRPRPGVSKATISSQIPADDAFMLSYNLENLSASRRGYDLVSQDPFFLLQNSKYEVFARSDPQRYFIAEKRTVPLGFTLIQEVAQGTVFWESLVSSETEYQRSVSTSFGARAGSSSQSSDNPFAASVAVDSASAYMDSLKQGNSIAQALGYSRSKQYALVVDHPYITLSDDFIDAVDDARRYGKYHEIIEKFGTHYPYAVTYGAAAKMTQTFTQESYTEIAQQDTSFGASGGGTVYGIGGMVDYRESISDRSTMSGSIGNTGATFVAVGGNGSWNESGYSAGNVPYPVLLDLRPLDELLNPMNFPGEPEMYTTIRRNLKNAIREYLHGYSNSLSSLSLLPEVEELKPEPVEKWLVYVRHTWCGDHKLINPVKKISGSLKAEVQTGSSYTSKRNKKLVTPCKKNSTQKTWSGKGQNLITLTGTRSELARKRLNYVFDWRYVPAFDRDKLSSQRKTYSLPLNKNLSAGDRHDVIWVVKGKANLPQLRIRLRFKRVQ